MFGVVLGGSLAYGTIIDSRQVEITYKYIVFRVRTQEPPRAPQYLHAMSPYFY